MVLVEFEFMDFILIVNHSFYCSWEEIIRFSFSSQSSAKGIHSAGMDGNANTVPSIVVYVTVPNQEAGQSLYSFPNKCNDATRSIHW